MPAITIPREKIDKQGGVVILSLEEYQKLSERAVPTYYLKGKEAKNLDKLVEGGLKEHERGESIKASSLKEALSLFIKRNGKKH